MKKIASSLVLGAMLVAGTAQAHLIDLGLFDYEGNNSTASELAFIIDNFDEPSGLAYLNRFDTQAGDFQNDGALNTGINVDLAADELSADVDWDLTGTGWQLDYVLVKAASDQVRIYAVSDDQKFVGGPDEVIFGDNQISHITFFGSPGRQVPDGGVTLGLLGLGLTLVEGLRRRINR